MLNRLYLSYSYALALNHNELSVQTISVYNNGDGVSKLKIHACPTKMATVHPLCNLSTCMHYHSFRVRSPDSTVYWMLMPYREEVTRCIPIHLGIGRNCGGTKTIPRLQPQALPNRRLMLPRGSTTRWCGTKETNSAQQKKGSR